MSGTHRRHPGWTGVVAGPVLFAGFCAVVAVVQFAQRVLAGLIGVAVVWAGWRIAGRIMRRHQALAAAQTPRVLEGHPVSEADLDAAELARLRDENSALKAKCRTLSDMINGVRRQP